MATSINTAEIPVTIVASATAASYTVPSDRYAIVKAQVKSGGTLSIGGVVVLGSDTWTVITNSNNLWRTPGNLVLSNSTGVFNGFVPVGGLTANGTGGTVPPSLINVSSGSGFVQQTTRSGDISTGVFGNDTAKNASTAEFKVPAGTVIVGAGDSRYLIELYRIPGSAT